MLFIAEFSDGSTGQIVGNDLRDAKMTAMSTFKDKLVLSVRRAGLLEMSQRRSTSTEEASTKRITDDPSESNE
jgi:hypothetical protein